MKRFTVFLTVLSILVVAGLTFIFIGGGGSPALEAAPVLAEEEETELSGVIVLQGGVLGKPYEIYLLHLATSQMVNLTDDAANDIFPSLSPDGGQILFASNREGGATGFDVYVMDADGANVVNLTQDGVSDEGVWSPDGRQIAVRKNLEELWIMEADGGSPTQVPLPEGAMVGGVLSWSAAGDRLAFNCTVGEKADELEVCAVNTDGSGWANLTDNPGYDFGAVWSPGGDKIAFMSQRDGDNEVYVMDADGSNQVNLTNNPAADGSISWSPDGSQIFFASDRDEGVGLYVMDADGSNPTRLAEVYPITGLARPICLIPEMTELPPAPTAVPPSELAEEGAAPPAAGEVPADLPVMADAQISVSQENLLVYHTDSSIAEAADFYQSQMPELGWSQMEGVGMVTEDMAMMQFEKEGKIAQVLIMPDAATGEGTQVSISLQ